MLSLKFTRNKLYVAFGIITFITISGTYLSGYSSTVANIEPIIPIGSKETTLFCNYRNSRIEIEVKTYSNINNYYKHNISKNKLVNSGDYAGLTYVNTGENVVKDLADKIRDVASQKNLSSDQMIELASCLVQNIPYDDKKAETVLSSGSISNQDLAQFPYETIYKNSGICTDKTYLGSALIKELGYGTGIMLFPEAQHMALGIKAPAGYTDFGTKYTYVETTTPDFVIGEVPSEVSDANGQAAVAIQSLSDLTISDNPTSINRYVSRTISSPNLVIDVNDGNLYTKIVDIVNLENAIVQNYSSLVELAASLESSYSELNTRKSYMDSTYSSYLNTPSTILDCGYKYDYSYSYLYSYSYSSPYKYSCDYVTNPAKNRSYNTYSYAVSSYNNQVNYYNSLLGQYNSKVDETRNQITKYKTYQYN